MSRPVDDSNIIRQETFNSGASKKNPCSLMVAIGIILLLGSVFLLLAYYRILPQGINAISNLGGLGAIAAWGTLILGASMLMIGVFKKSCATDPNSSGDIKEHLKKVFTVMPEVKEKMRYPIFLACASAQRCEYIQKMSEKEFYNLCHYFFQTQEGKALVEISDAILADFRAYPNWEAFARSQGAPQAWIQAIKNAQPA